MSGHREEVTLERQGTSRRNFVKKLAYVAPVITTLVVTPAEARAGSGHIHTQVCGHLSTTNYTHDYSNYNNYLNRFRQWLSSFFD